jgi:hypothetical protein
MSMEITRFRLPAMLLLSHVIPLVAIASAQAGDHKKRLLVPVYAQQAPAPIVYGAPTAVTYATQAPAIYSAPAATMYSAPVATQVYSAPAPVVYSAPPQTQAGVGNAPGMIAGSRIKAVDRADIIEELRKDYKNTGTDGTRRDRRKALRESAKTKFGEAIGDDAEGLNESELQDIENIANSIIENSAVPTGSNGSPYGSPAPVYTTTNYAPAQPSQLFQPVVPVQLWVPVPQKHRLFHH